MSIGPINQRDSEKLKTIGLLVFRRSLVHTSVANRCYLIPDIDRDWSL
jgi:hypothetical protein